MMKLLQRILHSPGVRQFGIPLAVAITLFKAFQRNGLTWSVLTTSGLWTSLGSSLVVIGIIGGLAFEWLVAKMGFPMPTESPDDDRDHAA
jgi:hypothetical protein